MDEPIGLMFARRTPYWFTFKPSCEGLKVNRVYVDLLTIVKRKESLMRDVVDVLAEIFEEIESNPDLYFNKPEERQKGAA